MPREQGQEIFLILIVDYIASERPLRHAKRVARLPEVGLAAPAAGRRLVPLERTHLALHRLERVHAAVMWIHNQELRFASLIVVLDPDNGEGQARSRCARCKKRVGGRKGGGGRVSSATAATRA